MSALLWVLAVLFLVFITLLSWASSDYPERYDEPPWFVKKGQEDDYDDFTR